jgi:hypothetical protein
MLQQCIKNDDINGMKWTIYVARMDEMRNAYKVLVVELEGTKLLTRCSCIWVDNIKWNLNKDRCVLTGFIWLRIGTSDGLDIC